jgi:quinol monooxygenase YgiN
MIGAVMDSSASSKRSCCAVLELRQYTLKPGQRDALIDVFDEHFVESQEALGMIGVGQVRDRRRSDRFVWVRGFSDMKSRHAALEQFYGGPVWAAHKAAANETMLDSDNVLLLKPARPDLTFRVDPLDRPAAGEDRTAVLVLAGIHPLPQPADAAILARFERQVLPVLRASGVELEGVFVTESAPNTFIRLPVREGEHVLVWFGTMKGSVAAAREAQPGPGGFEQLTAGVSALSEQPAVLLELDPTGRSLLGHCRR